MFQKSANELHVTYKTLDKLSAREFHQIIALRESVFVVEQNCAYQDADNLDIDATHLCGKHHTFGLIGYLRILPPQTPNTNTVGIGRVVTHPHHRGQGIASSLLQNALVYCQNNYKLPIRISAQLYLKNYYAKFGFVADGCAYLEDNIQHIAMVLDTA